MQKQDTSSTSLMRSAGLEDHEIELYTGLIHAGESAVSDILENTKLSRATVYGVLSSLVDKQLVKYRKEGRNAYYAPAHPSRLHELLHERKQELAAATDKASRVVDALTQNYEKANAAPGVRMYIGEAMAEEVFMQSNDAKEVVYSITNRDGFELHSADVLDKAIKERAKPVHERVLVLDGPKGRELFEASQGDQYLEVKILPQTHEAFMAGMDMYDGKIIYGTHASSDTVTAIIEDPELCNMQRTIFEALWNAL